MLKRLVLPLLAAITLFLTACQLPNLMPGNAAPSPRLQLSWNLGRTILPTSFPTPASYAVVLTSTDQTPVTLSVTGNTVTLNDLAKAVWTATVTAKDAAGTAVASGAVDIDLTGADTASATVTLRYVASGDGTGQIHLSLDLAAAPDPVAAVEATLIDPAGGVSYPKVTLNGSSASLEVASAKAGSQNLFLVVKTLSKTAMKQESVLVLAGGDTVGTLTLTAADFDSSYVKYLYSGAGTTDFAMSADDWGTGTTIDTAYTGDGTYSPVIQLTSKSGAWGTPIGFNDISPKGILGEFTGLKMKVKANGFTSLKVKLPGAGKEEVTYIFADGKALADGWTQLIVPFSDFNGVPATLNQVGIFGPGSGSAAGSTILLADIGFTGQAAVSPSGLTAAITAAKALNSATVVGTADGNVSQATQDSYTAAIAAAEAAPVTGWPQINAALTALDTATKAFKAGIVHLVPTTLAPAPTTVAGNVISLLNTSATYTNAPVGNWNPNWGQAGSLTDVTIAGKTVKLLDLKSYQGVNISSDGLATGTGVLDVSDKPILHLSYWSANGTSFNLYPITTNEVAIPVTVSTRNAWTDVEIDLTKATGGDLSKLRQLKFDGGSGQVYYLDNIYFHTDPATSLTVTPTTVSVAAGAIKTVTTQGATVGNAVVRTLTGATWTSSDEAVATVSAGVITGVSAGTATITASKDGQTATVAVTVTAAVDTRFFADAYASGVSFVPFGGAPFNLVTIDSTTANSGTSSLKIDLGGSGWCGGALVSAAAMDLSSFNAVSFYIKGTKAFDFEKFGVGNDPAGSTALSAEFTTTKVPVTTSWTKITLPLPAADKRTSQKGLFHWGSAAVAGTTVWLDDIKFETLPPNGTTGVAVKTAVTGAETISLAPAATKTLGGLGVPTYTVLGKDWNLSAAPSFAFVTLTSSNPSVATVDASGVVTAVAAGTATIAMTLDGVTVTGTKTVTVVLPKVLTAAAPTPTLPASHVTALWNSSGTYTNSTVDTWRTGWSGGSAAVADFTIPSTSSVVKKYTGLSYAGIEFAANKVDASVKKFFHADLWIPAYTTPRFLIKLVQATGGEIQLWEDNVAINSSYVAGVDETGKWISIEANLASIAPTQARNQIFQIVLDGAPGAIGTVYLDNIYFHSEPVTALSVDQTTVSVNNGATKTVVLTGTTATGSVTVSDAVWTSSDTSVATATGSTISGLSAGTAVLTATKDGKTATVNVTVNAVTLSSLSASPASATIDAGATKAVTITGTYSDASTAAVADAVWSTDNASVATASAGVITGVAAGTATITATKGGKSVDIAVTVMPIAPTSLPAAPAIAAASVISLYNSSGTYTDISGISWNPNWGQGGSIADATVATKTVKLMNLVNYQGVDFSGNVQNITGKTTLHLSVWTNNGGAFNVYAITSNDGPAKTTGALTAYAWTDVEIDCSGASVLTAVKQLKFDGGTGKKYYFDNIYFH